MNHVVLTACIAEVSAIRYTPAGLPALDLRLEHASHIEEAGEQRAVKTNVKSVALGSVAERLVQQSLGSEWQVTGF